MTEPNQQNGSISSTNSGGTAGGFLSKITRSPSRRHKPLGSNDSIDATLSAAAGSPPPRPRPGRIGYQRTTTAPAAPVTLNAIKADLVARTNSDISGLTTADNMIPLPSHLLSDKPNARTPLHKVPSNGGGGTSNQKTANNSTSAVPADMDVPSALALNGMLLSTSGPAISNSASTATLYAHIQEMTNKRIATLDYLRKAHEGRSFWFNTVQFNETDIGKLPSYTPNRLSRRAVNYMLLGMSLPTILDVHPQSHAQSTATSSAAVAQDYLKSLNTLLSEFESFQQLHPPDGSSASSLSRARIPQMFKRAATTSRPRKSSGPVAEIGLPMFPHTSSPPNLPETGHHGSQPSIDTTTSGSTLASSAPTLVTPSPSAPLQTANFPSASAFPPPAPFDAPNSTLLPNEGPYTHLQTPPLPFTPDFFTVFATLCDVLIDTYQRLLQILTGPPACTPVISDLFTKVDGRIRKVMISAIVREFENASRETVKREMLGVQKAVLGGLMA
ncbi:uncharacterized protein Z518_05860 [Rhinocladiella mackenziei CBS 650.93]|uniref:Uncharacterized protein n=1 Tax=Rhinocladiella mackenziei CBS 650.93 TaxID=1442369 RepID=A0A0D2H3L1_9EURO|nr:uncharacterized protein Z518_05860 [Rhinocladiella mackenziei CBS 650.93]KIX04988.1 hypothetical protein Z518_05860 [Rhinocladiella mackenziei CBS 650.93]